MTADNSTPDTGKDSTELDSESYPMREASEEELALAIEEEKEKFREAANEVSRALLNDDAPLTGEKVAALWDSADRTDGLMRTLVERVPEEHEIEGDPEQI
jgi:hypothetical protein